MSKYGPNAQLTAVTHHWGDYYTQASRKSVLDGTWKPDNVWGGIKDGMIKHGAVQQGRCRRTCRTW